MSNFIETYKVGKEGKNRGLPTGIKALDKAINGLKQRTSIGLAAAPKVGKTKLCDYAFVISPYLYYEALDKLDNIEWHYFSYEIDRVSKEFNYAAFFMAHDHKVYNATYKGKVYEMSADYLRGEQLHENPDGTLEVVKVQEEHEELLKIVYEQRIKPLFGEWDCEGELITPGKIHFFEEPENPTGVNKYLMNYARQNGEFKTVEYSITEDGRKVIKHRITGYIPVNPEKFTIVIADHIRKFRRERGFTMKENIDKWLEYQTLLRNMCRFTFINIIHSNRNISNVERLKFAGEYIFPTADDCKDSGNPAEECTIFMTLFNPHDEKYSLTKHMGVNLKDFPNYRSIHITESRNTKCPVHIQVNVFAGIGMYTSLTSNNQSQT